VSILTKPQQGVIFATSAYLLWAMAPIYFKALGNINAFEVLAHRIFWSFLFTLMVLYFLRRQHQVLKVLKDSTKLSGLLLSTLLIGFNWGLFIWAIQENQILSASLGYYINPLVSILFGIIFLKEKLDFSRRAAAVFCIVAVGFELIKFGSVPILALSLAISFALYGLVRKKLGVDSFVGLAVESGILAPFALVYIFVFTDSLSRYAMADFEFLLLLVMAGPVTMAPLLCFSAAANRISLTVLGFFQYIAPTGMLVLAVFVYDEAITQDKLVTFAIIWTGLLILVLGSLRTYVHERRKKVVEGY